MRAVIAIGLIVFGLALAPAGAAAQSPIRDILAAVVRIDAEVPASARTAEFLGTERTGSGVVIDSNGLVVTIGYLILEAMAASVTDRAGHQVPAEIVAYDSDTGFGLLRARGPLETSPLRLGDSAPLEAQTPLLALSFGGGEGGIVATYVTSREPVAGYRDYLLERAIYTAPPHPQWAGAALVGPNGRLVGIGSLYLRNTTAGRRPEPRNLFVPINLLKPILGELIAGGRAQGPQRPWLGMFTGEAARGVDVFRVVPEGPAEAAGIREGDSVLAVAGQEIEDMADLFRKVWALGEAGVEVPLEVYSNGATRTVVVRSIDRYDYLRLDPSY